MSLQGQHLEKSIDIFLSFSKYNKCKELFVRKAMTRGWAGVYFSNNNKINFLHMSIHYCFATFHNCLEKYRQGQTNGQSDRQIFNRDSRKMLWLGLLKQDMIFIFQQKSFASYG